MERGQAEILLPMIAAVLADARYRRRPRSMLIGVATGPGSFTGLRIAIAAARGLALATGVPAIGITRFAAIAARFPPSHRGGRSLLVALDTKRDDFFLQLFREDQRRGALPGKRRCGGAIAPARSAARWQATVPSAWRPT